MHLEVDIGQSDDNTKTKLIVINNVLIIVFKPENFFIKKFGKVENTMILYKYEHRMQLLQYTIFK